MNDDLDKLLQYDPLAEAEKSTGKRWTESEFTAMLGMANALDHNAKKDAALRARDDTVHSDTPSRYLDIANAIGFREVLYLPFTGKDGQKEGYVILWHDAYGILLDFDTHHGHINCATFYFNWKPEDGSFPSGCSGHFTGDTKPYTLIGFQDAREALRYHVQVLADSGDFVLPWVENPVLWLKHHADEQRNDQLDFETQCAELYRLTSERWAKLPPEVLRVVGSEPRRRGGVDKTGRSGV